MAFSRPILIEHELIVSEEHLRAPMVNNHVFFTSVKDVQNFAKTSFELITNCGESSDRVALSLNCDLGSDANGRLRGTFSFYNKSANFVLHSSRVFKEGNNNNYSYDEIGTVSDLLNPEKKFIEDGKLTIQMKGMLFREKQLRCLCNCCMRDKLSIYLWLRHDDRDFVVSVGKKDDPKTEIKVHKNILASRSPVFDRMLESNMKESAENKLEIIDFDPEIVQVAIEYFYDQNDYIYFDVENLICSLQFADKYDIEDYKNSIEELLYRKLSPANVCEIANASILSNSPKLKDLCFRFMIIYIKQGIPFDHAENLDKDLASELLKKASMPIDDLLL